MADTTDQPPPPKSLKRKHDEDDASGQRRALRACLPCRKRKVKCSGTRPCCENCLRLRDQCHWADDDPEPGALFKALHKPENVVNTEQRQILVDIFFSTPHLDIIRQSIHRPSFESTETGPQSPFLLVAIYSLSALYISDVDVRGNFNGEQAKAVSQRLALVAQHYSRDTSDQPTVPSTQANLILGFRELLCRTGLKSWMYTGLAIRMAQALRLGREYHQRHPTREQEVRRRTMWTCFIMDRLVSHITGRPQGIRTISLQQHLPCPESAFLFEEAAEPQPTLEEGPNPESCEVFPYFIKAVELWGIMSDMFSKNVKGPPPTAPSDPQGSFYQAEQKVKSWIRSLPPRMQWSMKNHRTHKVLGQGSMFVSLHFVIHHALCVAHQEYLPQLEGDSQFPSSPFSDPSGIRDVVATCLHHANEITRMAFQPNDRSMLWSPFVGIALECAGCCHLWSIHLDPNAEIHDSSSQQPNFAFQPSKVAAKQKLCFLCGILKSWADIWPIAAAWKETIHLLGKFYDAFLPSNGPTMDGSFCPNPDDFGYQPPSSTDISLGSGLPDPRDPGLARRLIDKVRLIIMTASESSDLRHRQTRLWVENLWTRTLNQVQGGTDSNSIGPEEIDLLLGFGEFSDFEDMLEFMGGSVDGYEDPSFTVAALDSIDQPHPVPFP